MLTGEAILERREFRFEDIHALLRPCERVILVDFTRDEVQGPNFPDYGLPDILGAVEFLEPMLRIEARRKRSGRRKFSLLRLAAADEPGFEGPPVFVSRSKLAKLRPNFPNKVSFSGSTRP
jgi:hypothetical protein